MAGMAALAGAKEAEVTRVGCAATGSRGVIEAVLRAMGWRAALQAEQVGRDRAASPCQSPVAAAAHGGSEFRQGRTGSATSAACHSA
eukprot:6517224-Prymnesium_polylepis.2